jgi:hypothetical protein
MEAAVTVHPAAEALADHQPVYVTPSQPGGGAHQVLLHPVDGPLLDFPTHQAAILAGPGLLAETMEPAPIRAKHPRWPIGDVR